MHSAFSLVLSFTVSQSLEPVMKHSHPLFIQSGFQLTVEKPKPKQLFRPITTGTNSAMNQSQFLAITCNSLEAREKSRVHGAIGFGFTSHLLKSWREPFQPITKSGNRNCVITFDSLENCSINKGIKRFSILSWTPSVVGQKVSTKSLMAALSHFFPSLSFLFYANIGTQCQIITISDLRVAVRGRLQVRVFSTEHAL